MDPDRLKEIANIGIAGFWSHVKKNLPHVQSSTVDPELANLLARAAECAVLDWGKKNDRDEWTELGSVIDVEFSDKIEALAETGEESVLAFVWSSDFQTFRTRAEIRPLNWELRHYKPGRSQSGVVDPGLVKLEYDLDSAKWSWITEKCAHLEVKVRLLDEAPITSAWLAPNDRTTMVVSQILSNDDPEMMRVRLPDNFEQAMLARDSIRRLVAELNMTYYALAHG